MAIRATAACERSSLGLLDVSHKVLLDGISSSETLCPRKRPSLAGFGWMKRSRIFPDYSYRKQRIDRRMQYFCNSSAKTAVVAERPQNAARNPNG